MNFQMTPFYLRWLLVGLMAFPLMSCEKAQTDVINIGGEFCAVNFGYTPEQSILPGCNVFDQSQLQGSFGMDTAISGLVWEQPLFRANKPYFSPMKDPSNRFVAYNLSGPDCGYLLRFEKISMDTCTRVSFYLGRTRQVNQVGDPIYYKGNYLMNSEPGPSINHTWQVFVQREQNGKYSLKYMADSVLYTAATNIADFDVAEFVVRQDANDGSIIKGDLFRKVNDTVETVASFSKQSQSVQIPNNLFPGIGANILEAYQDECTIKPVIIRLKTYLYSNPIDSEGLYDPFQCNTVLK